MSVADKLRLLKAKIENNISACKERHVYTGNKVDVSDDILSIRDVPTGQVCTYLRRPCQAEFTGDYFTNQNANTVMGTGENPISYNSWLSPYFKIYDIEGNLLYELFLYTTGFESNWRETVIRFMGFQEKLIFEFYNFPTQSGTYTDKIEFTFPVADFQIKPNTITELVVDYSKVGYFELQLHRVLVRYVNP